VPLENPERSELTGIILLARSSFSFIRSLLLCSHFSSGCVRSSVHELTSNWKPGSAPSSRCASARAEETPQISFYGSPPLGFSVPYLARLELVIGYRQAANGCGLASHGLSLVLDLEGSTRTTGTPRDCPRNSRPDPQDVAGESYVGRTPHSRRVAETRHRHRREQCHEVHGALPQATFSNLAHFPRQPRRDPSAVTARRG